MQDEQPRSWIQKNYKAFNGIRGLAVSMVFFSHFGNIAARRLHKGITWAGVDLFFVLSGFLITGILHTARASPTYYRDFYIRRSLRILPVYWGLLLAVLLFGHVRHLEVWRALRRDFFFLQNLVHRGIALGTVQPSPIALSLGHSGRFLLDLGALWSLCVEEQFYLLWPFVVRFANNRVLLIRIALVGTICVLGIRAWLFHFDHAAVRETDYTYFEPYCRFDSLLIGAALNIWLQRRKLTRSSLRRISTVVFSSSSVLLAIALVTLGSKHPMDETNPVIQTFGLTLVAIASASVLLRSLDDTSRLSRFLRFSPLQNLGVISYGFYVYHALFHTEVDLLASKLHQPVRFLILPLIFGLTYVVSLASYRFYESPFLRLKDRFAPSHRSVPSGHAGKLVL